MHRTWVAGICSGRDGVESVVVSGGYEDDQDDGNEVVYTGEGGNAKQGGGRQVKDQQWNRGNAGLARNCFQGSPLRLVRGAGGAPGFAPESGCRYDGLYRIQRYWEDTERVGTGSVDFTSSETIPLRRRPIAEKGRFSESFAIQRSLAA